MFICVSLLVLLILSSIPVYAHHPFDGNAGPYNFFQGLLSGLAHPVLGLDHFLFLLSVGLSGFLFNKRYIALLIGSGLVGSMTGLTFPGMPGAEMIMGLSLTASAFVCLGRLNPSLMIPLIALHGYVLSGVMLGSEPTPLFAYHLGLFISETLLVLLGLKLLRSYLAQKNILAGILLGASITITYSHLVA